MSITVPPPPAHQTLIDGANQLLQRLRRHKGKQVSSTSLRNTTKAFVRQYFAQYRDTFPPVALHSKNLSHLDNAFQDLMRCTQARTTVPRYVAVLKTIASDVHEIEIATLTPTDAVPPTLPAVSGDQLLLDTLGKLSPSARHSLEQGLLDLEGPDRLSWRGPAVEFREALREVLDTLAPDSDVESQANYKQEKDTNGPTMKQKVVFILRSRNVASTEVKTLTDAVAAVDEKIGSFVRSVYQHSSVATHTVPSRDDVRRIYEYVRLALIELLEIKRA